MLKSSDAGLLEFFDEIPIAMLVTDADGRIEYLNHDCAKMFGYTTEEAIGLTVEDFVPRSLRSVHIDYRSKYCEAPTRRTMGADRIVTGVRKDGTEIPVEIGLGTLPSSAGVRFVATIEDITRQRQNEAMLQLANSQLVQRNAELDEFVHIASHDLQEPIRKLISFSELLAHDLGGELPERAATDVKFIVESAYRMRQLVQDLLTLSRTGKSSLKMERVDLGQCVKEVLSDLEDTIESSGGSVDVPALPTVYADRLLMMQTFQNLISNALKFVPEGVAPKVTVTVERGKEGPIFGVKDAGIGIAPTYHERIFTSFRRLHTRSEYDGTGVGLSICRKAVERQGGRIWVESTPGAGAHFKFTLGQTLRNHE